MNIVHTMLLIITLQAIALIFLAQDLSQWL